MEKTSNNLRERLLARLPQPGNFTAYQAEVESELEKNQRGFRREKWFVSALWLFMVGLSTAFLCLGGKSIHTPLGPYFTTLAGFVLIYPSVELLKHFINRSRVEVLKEVKQLQLQVLELQASLEGTGGEKM
jgi:hypothetical protein